MNKCDIEQFHHYLFRYRTGSTHDLYLQPTHFGYSLDDKNQVASGGQCQCTWNPPQLLKADDATCSQTAALRLTGAKSAGTNRIAAAGVVEYESVNGQGTLHRLSLAPEYGCEVMAEVVRTKGTLGIPGAQWRYPVTSYEPGEPRRNVFELPPGYRIESTK